MPIFDNPSNAPAPAYREPSALDNFIQAGDSIVQSVTVPLRELGQNYALGITKPKEVKVTQKPAWDAASPQADKLRIWGMDLPLGAILTHCRVSEQIGYRAHPLSDVTPVSLEAMISQQIRKVLLKGKAGEADRIQMEATFQGAIRKDKFSSSPAADKVVEIMNAVISSNDGKSITPGEQLAQAVPLVTPYLLLAAQQSSIAKLRAKVGKVYLGDPLPRRAELQFILEDVVSLRQDGGQTLSRSRYDVLYAMHERFCRNRFGSAPADRAYTALSDAARITASATAGHLVKLEMPSLDPYNVDQWLVANFEAIERPDLDVIAVRVQLVEFISVLSAHVEDPNKAPEVSTTMPASSTRPSYVGTLKGVQP